MCYISLIFPWIWKKKLYKQQQVASQYVQVLLVWCKRSAGVRWFRYACKRTYSSEPSWQTQPSSRQGGNSKLYSQGTHACGLDSVSFEIWDTGTGNVSLLYLLPEGGKKPSAWPTVQEIQKTRPSSWWQILDNITFKTFLTRNWIR